MTTRFLKAIPEILKHEGGFNDIKEDRGGATNYGISLVFLKSINEDINDDGRIDWLDIKSLSQDDAKQLYWDNFWKPLYDRTSEKLGIKLFDTAVNAGNGRAHMILQQSLQSLGSKISVDGVIGNQTMSEIAKYSDKDILNAYCIAQLNFYKGIVAKKPDQVKFLGGWTNRAKWLPA